MDLQALSQHLMGNSDAIFEQELISICTNKETHCSFLVEILKHQLPQGTKIKITVADTNGSNLPSKALESIKQITKIGVTDVILCSTSSNCDLFKGFSKAISVLLGSKDLNLWIQRVTIDFKSLTYSTVGCRSLVIEDCNFEIESPKKILKFLVDWGEILNLKNCTYNKWRN